MTHRILLADDSVTIRKVVELTFSEEDFTLDSVGDGVQALEHARAQRPDIIISDVVMPGMNGYEFCQKIKADPALRSVPFLFLRGTFESFDDERARSCGADGFIVKPFESQEMIGRVKDLIAAAVVPPAAAPAARPIAAPSSAPAPPVRETVAPQARIAPPAPVDTQPAAAPRQPAPQTVLPVPPPRPAPVPAPALSAAPRPAPPIAPRPLRPVTVVPPPPPPLPPPRPMPRIPTPEPGVAQRPAAPAPPLQPAARTVQPVSAPAPTRAGALDEWFAPAPAARPPSAPPPAEEYGFDFADVSKESFASLDAQAEAKRPSAPVPEPAAETSEDLWSEVSLRDHTTDFLESAPPAEAPWPESVSAGLEQEAARAADEAIFDEISTAIGAPPAQVELEPAQELSLIAPEPLQETLAAAAVAAAPPPVVPAAPAAPPTCESAEMERIVSARMEAVVRQVLEPVVSELARTMIEAVAWEVIPELAEAMIQSEIRRIRQTTSTG